MNTIKRQLKQAFTIVELVVVIAVIAALAAILIPTFVNVISSANESNDTVLAKNLDTSLITVESKLTKTDVTDGDGNYIYNVTEAITLVRNDGYDVSKLTPTADNADYVYNATTNRFLYYTDNFTALTYGEEPATTDTLVVIDNDLDRVDEVTSSTSLLKDATVQYCVYSTDVVTISTDKPLTIWVYTESGTSTITATNSVVYRYGEGTQDSAAVDGNSYYLYGKIDTIVLSQGHLNVKNENCVKDVILYVSTSDNQPYVTGSAVENLVIDTTTTGVTYSSENKDKTTVTATNTIEKDSSLASVEGYGTATNPFVVDSADTLSTILNGTYTNVTIEVSDSEGSSSTVTASKNDDNEIFLSGELSETYYAAVSDSVTLGDEYRTFVSGSGSSSVTLEYALANAELRIGSVYYDEFVLIAVSSSVTSNTNGSFTTITIGSTGTETNIVLLSDVILSQYAISIAANASISIDLNGYELAMVSSLGNRITLQEGATFTLDDSSSDGAGILSSNVPSSTYYGSIFIYANKNTIFNFDGGKLINYVKDKYTVDLYGENSIFNMTSGAAISTPNGCSTSIVYGYKSTTTINISSGYINSTKDTDVYYGISSSGTLEISGSTVIYAIDAVKVASGGIATISGGTITGTRYAVYSSGSSTSTTSVNINGGTISGATYAIYCNSYTDVNVTGGTVSSIYFNTDTSSATVSNSVGSTVTTNEDKYTLSTTPTGSSTGYTVTVTSDKAYAYIVRNEEYLYYASLSAAISGALDGETIYMLKDSSGISTSKTLTIDMNGHTISSSSNAVVVSAGGNLTLVSSSAATIKTTSTSSTWAFYALKVYPSATLTLGENITATSAGYWTAFVGENNSTDKYDTIATLNVYGTITNTNSNGAAVLGYGVDLVGGTVINIYDGAVIESAGLGIYHPQVGTLNIYGGTITGVTGIEMRSGTLNVTGGTITSTATEFSVNANGSGSTVSGAAIAISQHTTQQAITVTISGGTISGYYALYETDTVATTTLSENVTITISGSATLTSTAADATNGYYSANNVVTDSRTNKS